MEKKDLVQKKMKVWLFFDGRSSGMSWQGMKGKWNSGGHTVIDGIGENSVKTRVFWVGGKQQK